MSTPTSLLHQIDRAAHRVVGAGRVGAEKAADLLVATLDLLVGQKVLEEREGPLGLQNDLDRALLAVPGLEVGVAHLAAEAASGHAEAPRAGAVAGLPGFQDKDIPACTGEMKRAGHPGVTGAHDRDIDLVGQRHVGPVGSRGASSHQ